jgi:hypothetical protein
MAAAAQRGKVFVVGAAVAADEWTATKEALQRAVKSFRLRDTANVSVFKS